MADTKISALTAASTPLAGTEYVPIVQGGVTLKARVSDLWPSAAATPEASTSTAGIVRIDSNGGLENAVTGLRANSQVAVISVNTGITAASHHVTYICSTALSLGLPYVSAVWNGFAFKVFAYNGAVTLSPQSSDQANGGTAGATLVVPSGSYATITCDGSNHWWASFTALYDSTGKIPTSRMYTNTASNLVALNSSTQLPAVDASLLTGLTLAQVLNGSKVPTSSLNTNTANNVVALNGTAQLPAVSGANLTGLSLSQVLNGAKVPTSSLNTNSASNVVALDADSKLPAVDGTQLTGLVLSSTFSNAMANVAYTNVAQSFTKQQYPAPTVRTNATGAQAVDCDTHQVLSITMSGNVTISAPTNMAAEKWVTFRFYQPGSYTITWNAAWKANYDIALPTAPLASKWLSVSFCCVSGSTMMLMSMVQEA